jgi:hypothetical protein
MIFNNLFLNSYKHDSLVDFKLEYLSLPLQDLSFSLILIIIQQKSYFHSLQSIIIRDKIWVFK